MRRLTRRLFTLCSAASLLACVASLALWAQSYHYQQTLSYRSPLANLSQSSVWASVVAGRFVCERSHQAYRVPPTDGEDEVGTRFNRKPYSEELSARLLAEMLERQEWAGWGYSFRRYGFKVTLKTYSDESRTVVHRSLILPCWGVVAATTLAPAIAAVSWGKRRRRARTGRCVLCGYDLRATPGRCPECGTAASTADAPAAPPG